MHRRVNYPISLFFFIFAVFQPFSAVEAEERMVQLQVRGCST